MSRLSPVNKQLSFLRMCCEIPVLRRWILKRWLQVLIAEYKTYALDGINVEEIAEYVMHSFPIDFQERLMADMGKYMREEEDRKIFEETMCETRKARLVSIFHDSSSANE